MKLSWGNFSPSILLVYGRVIFTKSPRLGFDLVMCVGSVCFVILAGILEKYHMSLVDMFRLVWALCLRRILYRGAWSGLALRAGGVFVIWMLASSYCSLSSWCCRDRSRICASRVALFNCVMVRVSSFRWPFMRVIVSSSVALWVSDMVARGVVYIFVICVRVGCECPNCVRF